MPRPARSADRRGAGRAGRRMRGPWGRRQDRGMIEHDVRPSPAPAAHASAAFRPAAPSTPSAQPYHRASRTLAHRRYWWRPLVTLAVSAAVFVELTIKMMAPLFALAHALPS